MSKIILRCEITGNPCGTDTRSKNQPCNCANCIRYDAAKAARLPNPFGPVLANLFLEIAEYQQKQNPGDLEGDR